MNRPSTNIGGQTENFPPVKKNIILWRVWFTRRAICQEIQEKLDQTLYRRPKPMYRDGGNENLRFAVLGGLMDFSTGDLNALDFYKLRRHYGLAMLPASNGWGD